MRPRHSVPCTAGRVLYIALSVCVALRGTGLCGWICDELIDRPLYKNIKVKRIRLPGFPGSFFEDRLRTNATKRLMQR